MDLKSRFENIKQDSQSSQINEHDAGKNPERTLLDDFKEVQAALLNEALEDIDTIDNENIERDIQSDPLNLKRPPALFKKWKTLAEQGDAFAQHKLGHIYRIGKGVAQDYKEAVRWYRLAAEQGFADAQYSLGNMYDGGEGVAQNYKEAAKWYRLAAEKGFASAQNNIGHMYNKGEGVPQNYKKAAKWYRLAAEQGFASAQNDLGCMYFRGDGVIQDYVLAHMWFNIAVSNGNKKARENRDITQKKMTPEQIAEAQKRAREYIEKNHTKEDAAKYKSNDSTIKVETDEDIPF